MILTLLAVSLNDQPLTRPIHGRFDANGGTIGRADHSTMALPDPERFISRKQAEIVCLGDGFMIRNVGAANPITVGSRSLAAGETAMLQHGEQIHIGGYLLRAELQTGPGREDDRAPDDAAPPTSPAVAARADAETRPPPPPPGLPLAPTVPADALAPPVPATPAAPVAPAFSAARPQAPAGADNPFADLLGSTAAAPGSDPFAGLLGPQPAAPPPMVVARPTRAQPAPAPAAPVAAPPQASPDPFEGLIPPASGLELQRSAVGAPKPPAAPVIPEDFDPFSAAALAPAPAAPVTEAGDPFAEFRPVDAGPSIDIAFGLDAPGSHDALARFTSDADAAPVGAAKPLPTDPLELFGAPAMPPAVLPPAPPQPDDLASVHAAYTPPRRVAPPPVAMPPPQPPSPPLPASATPQAVPPVAAATASGADDTQALWQAFCEGAGVRVPLPPGSGPERMQMIGRILRGAIEGTLQLMAVRASTKHEMRAAVTQIQARSNNPLKFSPDGAAGIEQLIQPPGRGFLDGPAAMDDAMQDLVGHSIGTVQGMRAALEGMLDRFDPAELEAKLGAGSILDNLLPMNRKAQLWELYLKHYRTIREEAQENFHELFGKAFVAAYEQQVARLKQRRRS